MGLYYASLLVLVVSSVFTIAADAGQHQCKVHPREINLFESLIQETDYLMDMNFIDGPNKMSPALLMDGSRGVYVKNTSLTLQRRLHEYSCSGRNEFVIRVCLKFDNLSPNGPIFFLHLNNITYLSMEVDSENGRSIKVRFLHDRKVRGISFPYAFADLTSWHNISIIFNGRLVSLYVNCEKVGDEVVMQPEYCLPKDVQVYIGDNPQHTQTFQGCLQDLIISFKEKGVAHQCPKAHTNCRFSAAYQTLHSSSSAVMAEYTQLREEVEELRRNLSMFQAMARRFACYVNGKQYDFETFFYKDDETICVCSQGGTPVCEKLAEVDKIPDKTGDNPNTLACEWNGQLIPVGDYYHDITKENTGTVCRAQLCKSLTIVNPPLIWLVPASSSPAYLCENSSKDCSKAHEWNEVERAGSLCCGFCTACDIQTTCGNNTVCKLRGTTNYTCECKEGYILENGECVDINECNHGHRPDVGHYCPSDAECINTDGGFKCKCPVNHTFIDRGGHTSMCQDIDECAENPNACPDTFMCNNTKGSYNCTCRDDQEVSVAGDRCIPRCDPPCRPEGQCIEHKDGNICSCPRGLHGKQCQHDMNECDDATERCSPHATCVNFHGGYFCRCGDGYRGNGNTCSDVDECTEKTANCPGNSKCVNTPGSYRCECPAGDCKDGCVNRNDLYPNNSIRLKGQKNCTECICNYGIWTCSEVYCNCSQNPTSPCCSHCNKGINETCTVNGQEYDHTQDIIYPSEPCKKCKCKHGTESCNYEGPSFECPPELRMNLADGCHTCKVDNCTEENDGTQVDSGNGCSVCTCKDKEWTCKAKVEECPKVECDDVVIVGCCPVCQGTSKRMDNEVSPSSSEGC